MKKSESKGKKGGLRCIEEKCQDTSQGPDPKNVAMEKEVSVTLNGHLSSGFVQTDSESRHSWSAGSRLIVPTTSVEESLSDVDTSVDGVTTILDKLKFNEKYE